MDQKLARRAENREVSGLFIYLLKCFSTGVPLYNEISATH